VELEPKAHHFKGAKRLLKWMVSTARRGESHPGHYPMEALFTQRLLKKFCRQILNWCIIICQKRRLR